MKVGDLVRYSIKGDNLGAVGLVVTSLKTSGKTIVCRVLWSHGDLSSHNSKWLIKIKG